MVGINVWRCVDHEVWIMEAMLPGETIDTAACEI